MTRIFRCALVALLVLVVTHTLLCLWIDGSLFGSGGGVFADLLRAGEQAGRRRELDARMKLLHRRYQEKQAITEALIAGRMEPREALRKFHELQDDIEGHLPGLTPEERSLNNLLQWVRTSCEKGGSDEPIRRLESQKASILAAGFDTY